MLCHSNPPKRRLGKVIKEKCLGRLINHDETKYITKGQAVKKVLVRGALFEN